MPIKCDLCGLEHDLGSMDVSPRFRFPDDVAALPPAALAARVREGDGILAFNARRYFLRALVRLPVQGEDTSWPIGTWLEVSRDDQARYRESRGRPLWPPIRGHIANRIPTFGDTLGVPAELIPAGDDVLAPTLKLLPSESPLFDVQRVGIPYEDVIALIHAGFGGDSAEERREAIQQLHRSASLRRFLALSAKHLGVSLPAPAADWVMPRLVSLFGPIEGPDNGKSEYVTGETIEEIIRQTDAKALAQRPWDYRLAMSVWNLDEESVAASRSYGPGDHIEDAGPLPGLVTLACVIALPDGEVALERVGDGWLPIVGSRSPQGSVSERWVRGALERLDGIEQVPDFEVLESHSGTIVAAIGWSAGFMANASVHTFENILKAGVAGRYLELPDRRAAELAALRREQCMLLRGFMREVAEAEEAGTTLPRAEINAKASEVSAQLKRLNARAGAKGGLLKMLREADPEIDLHWRLG